ncbi:MAG: T9SS type A sorting domain-containing protein [Saprospiraceae bacterium]|nr:T9SS type A sorting domain-containing protein [Saprospiraceae bacterium]MDW8230030.1 T9SS type A sorting domain-containing protein [Saprospiraceae bacterium]
MKYVLLLSFFLTLFAGSAASQSAARAELSVYPNPAVEYIAVNDPAENVGYVVMFNLVGKKVKELEYSKGANVPVGDLPKGMYMVQLQDRQRNVLKTQMMDKR